MARRFVSWVQPIAAALAADRHELVDFVRGAPAELWESCVGAEGWTRKEILAHLAGGNDQILRLVLRSATGHVALDPAIFQLDTDETNRVRVAERRSWPVRDLLAELERDGEEVQDLLSRLMDDDRALRGGGSMLSLGDFLHIVMNERHDREHLRQLQAERYPP